jgi:hypothetical protein
MSLGISYFVALALIEVNERYGLITAFDFRHNHSPRNSYLSGKDG